jgi:hypothetical protein
MKFLDQVTRKGHVFKIGDKVFSRTAGEYYIGAIWKDEQCESGIKVAGYKKKDDVDKYISSPENVECGFDDLNKIISEKVFDIIYNCAIKTIENGMV